MLNLDPEDTAVSWQSGAVCCVAWQQIIWRDFLGMYLLFFTQKNMMETNNAPYPLVTSSSGPHLWSYMLDFECIYQIQQSSVVRPFWIWWSRLSLRGCSATPSHWGSCRDKHTVNPSVLREKTTWSSVPFLEVHPTSQMGNNHVVLQTPGIYIYIYIVIYNYIYIIVILYIIIIIIIIIINNNNNNNNNNNIYNII